MRPRYAAPRRVKGLHVTRYPLIVRFHRLVACWPTAFRFGCRRRHHSDFRAAARWKKIPLDENTAKECERSAARVARDLLAVDRRKPKAAERNLPWRSFHYLVNCPLLASLAVAFASKRLRPAAALCASVCPGGGRRLLVRSRGEITVDIGDISTEL